MNRKNSSQYKSLLFIETTSINSVALSKRPNGNATSGSSQDIITDVATANDNVHCDNLLDLKSNTVGGLSIPSLRKSGAYLELPNKAVVEVEKAATQLIDTSTSNNCFEVATATPIHQQSETQSSSEWYNCNGSTGSTASKVQAPHVFASGYAPSTGNRVITYTYT